MSWQHFVYPGSEPGHCSRTSCDSSPTAKRLRALPSTWMYADARPAAFEELIQMKRETGRPKDKAAVPVLIAALEAPKETTG